VKPDLFSRLRLVRSRLRARWYAWWYSPSTDAEGDSSLRRRWDAHSALVMCAVAAVGIALGWWVWWQARPQLIDVGSSVLAEGSPPPLPTPTPTPAPGATPATGSAPPLMVDVEGRVRWPGVVLVPAGARVQDALRAAGGPRAGVSTRSLNLARPLADGEQIVLDPDHPTPSPVPTSTVGRAGMSRRPVAVRPSAAFPINLNTATSAELQTLPGVGPVLASRILAWRGAHGRFSTIQELQEVSGIGPARFAVLRTLVHV
jgi:competence protein ComEA